MEPQTAWNLLCRSGWLQTCNNLSASAVRTWNYKHGSPPARMTGSYQSSSTWPLAPTHKLAKAFEAGRNKSILPREDSCSPSPNSKGTRILSMALSQAHSHYSN